MKISYLRAFMCIVYAMLSHPIYGIIIGSDLVVSRQAFVTFPAIDLDNEIRGFAWMDGGFSLQNSSTTCLFNLYTVLNIGPGVVRLDQGSTIKPFGSGGLIGRVYSAGTFSFVNG